MRSPSQHLVAVRSLLPRARTTAPLIDATGHRLTRPVTAVVDSPRFDNSQMDGYALSEEHLATLPATFDVGADVAAGTDPGVLADQIRPVMTGARLPAGTVAIVPVEHCDPPEFAPRVSVPEVPRGHFIRHQGVDLAAGETLLPAGATLTPAGVAALASQGISEVEVEEPARIIICTGGAEIGTDIPDANAPMLHALARRAGITVAAHVATDDDVDALDRDLAAAVAEHQPTAIITSGGISHGKYEVIRHLLPDGWFGHVSQQPGGPQGLSTYHGVPVISLPGNPISTLVSFRLFVAPVLGSAPEPVTAVLDEDRTGLGDDRDQFLRGELHVDKKGVVRARGIGEAGSHFIAQAVEATALLQIPARATLTAGDTITVYPL